MNSSVVNMRKKSILDGRTSLGIELGSTRIKAVLIDDTHEAIASGEHDWESSLVNNIWTYSLADVWKGLSASYSNLKKDVKDKYGVTICKTASIGISAMMHGYLVFDKDDELLVPFRTWRNTLASEAADKLTDLFKYNIPLRWSISHLYQAILSDEEHIAEVSFMTTLSGYIHWKLTGRKVLGIGDASGMFPVDYDSKKYNSKMLQQFDELVAPKNLPYELADILPEVLLAGQDAGSLTMAGAKLLDSEGDLEAGIPLCPPEGDAGTGMVATNSVAVKTANVSAGTSIFAMLVLESDLTKVHKEIDMVTTPAGDPVAMVHGNNCSSDIDAWVSIFDEYGQLMGIEVDKNTIYSKLYNLSLEGDKDAGGLLTYNYFAGEPITDLNEGRPLLVRKPESNFTLANFMKANIYSAFGVLKIGLDILYREENVEVERVLGHGGIFKTPGVAQRYLAAAMETPVSVMETAGEGGAWGIALLASFLINNKENESLEDYLSNQVFIKYESEGIEPDPSDVEGFGKFMDLYRSGLPIEKIAVDMIR